MNNKQCAKLEKKKILFVATEPASGMIPFAEKVIGVMCKNPSCEVFAITFGYECQNHTNTDFYDDKHIINISYPTKKYVRLFYKFWPISIINQIKSMNKEHRFDVIHFLTGDFSMALFMLIHVIDDRFYYTVHDLTPHDRIFHLNRFLIFKYIDWGNRMMRKTISNLVTSSKEQMELLRIMYPNKAVYYTHFPSLVTDSIRFGGLRVKELVGIKNYILFFGNVNRYKGVDLLINAFKQSCLYDKTFLVIAGKGELGVVNDKRIIRLNRFIRDEEVKCLFENSCFVVYPYRSVTMTGVLSVAFYFRRKVVLSDLSFFKSYSNECTYFFKNGDTDDLCNIIEQVYKKRDHELFSDNYSSYYSDRLLMSEYNHIYTKL